MFFNFYEDKYAAYDRAAYLYRFNCSVCYNFRDKERLEAVKLLCVLRLSFYRLFLFFKEFRYIYELENYQK